MSSQVTCHRCSRPTRNVVFCRKCGSLLCCARCLNEHLAAHSSSAIVERGAAHPHDAIQAGLRHHPARSGS